MPGGLRRGAAHAVIWVALIAGAYQLFAILACVFFRSRVTGSRFQEVSILKPVRGIDAGFRDAIASHASLEAEVLCGVRSMNDPAVAILRDFPGIRIVECSTVAPNGKAGVLIDLAAAAKNPILIVNDADIRVPADYVERVTAPLADARVGLVTCLYRANGSSFASRFEALGVSTDFAPSTLVARMVGVDEFAMGSTMAFRRADLDRIGGFAAVADYLADDYQLGHRIHALGLKCVLSDVIVDTHLGGGWRDVWRHQIRWARTIRVSKFLGFLGLPVTFATLWALIAALSGDGLIAAALLAVRMAMAIIAGWFVMRSRDVLRLFWAIPLRDLFATAVWVAALFGSSVVWRGERLKLDREGRILAANKRE